MRELKYSKQREAIVECLKNRCDHPSADLVFQSLRKDNPKISLGTVYRNLNLLTEMGVSIITSYVKTAVMWQILSLKIHGWIIP